MDSPEQRFFDLPFLGQREYLQGTTLFETLEPFIDGGTAISLQLRKLIESNRILVESTGTSSSDLARFDAVITWLSKAEEVALGITGLPRREPIVREVFDEESLWERARFLDDAVEYPWEGRVHWVKAIVSLNKAMLTRKFQPASPGQWLFVRLDIERCVAPRKSLGIRFSHNVGLAAVVSEILVDEADAGRLQFSWAKRK